MHAVFYLRKFTTKKSIICLNRFVLNEISSKAMSLRSFQDHLSVNRRKSCASTRQKKKLSSNYCRQLFLFRLRYEWMQLKLSDENRAMGLKIRLNRAKLYK